MEAAECERRLRWTSQIGANASTGQEIVEEWDTEDGDQVT